jgi:DNA-binding PadR family transcriptional regulator
VPLANASDPATFLPLKPVELLVLTMLAAGDRHGYGIRQDILDHTDGRVEIEAGNLYRHIRGLEDEGLVAEAPAPRRESDERRIYYRLSPLGKRVLAAEMQRLRALVRFAEASGILAPARA